MVRDVLVDVGLGDPLELGGRHRLREVDEPDSGDISARVGLDASGRGQGVVRPTRSLVVLHEGVDGSCRRERRGPGDLGLDRIDGLLPGEVGSLDPLLDLLHVVGPVDLQLGDSVLDGHEHGVLLRGLALEELPRLVSLGSELGLHEGEDLVGGFRSHGTRQGAGTIIKPSGLKSETTNQSGSSREGVGLEPKWLRIVVYGVIFVVPPFDAFVFNSVLMLCCCFL